MTTTISTLEKNVEKRYEELTPEERAQWVSAEEIKIAVDGSKGINVSDREAELDRFVQKYVMPLNNWQYACFMRETDTCNIRFWAEAYFNAVLKGYDREEALIAL